MLHFPMFDIPLPKGNYYTFFDPVFNVADSAIFIGIVSILIFYRKMLLKEEPEKGPIKAESAQAEVKNKAKAA